MATEEKPEQGWEDVLMFKKGAVGIVQRHLKKKLWQSDANGTSEAKLNDLWTDLALHYGISDVTIVVNEHARNSFEDNTLTLTKASLANVLAAFAVHYRKSKGKPISADYMLAFTYGLFKKSAPKLFAKAKEEGKLAAYRTIP